MSGAIDVAVPTAPSPAGPGEVSHGRDAGTRGDAVGRETECSHVSAFFASREGRDTLAPLARCCVERAKVPRAAVFACLDCAALCSRAEARAHAVGTGSTDRGEDLGPNPNRVDRKTGCRGVFVDVRVAELFCAPCDARAYHRDFDRAVLGARALSATRDPEREKTELANVAPGTGEGARVDDDDGSARVAKRWRGAARSAEHDASAAEPSVSLTDSDVRSCAVGDAVGDAELIAMRAAELARVDARGVPRGVRSVVNLGNTCFMSTVLHATLRSPTVGGFFLRDGHVRELCRRAKGTAAEPFARGGEEPASHPCLACELDGLTSALYGGDSKPVVPATFLHSWWRQAPEHLRGQGQHDAHEFFLGLVSAVHADLARGATRDGDGKCDEATPARDARDDSRCSCPMHRAFSGTLRSDVTCGACGHVSTVADPTVGLSLDVPATPAGADELAGRGKTSPHVTLEECLRRFTRPERLCEVGGGDSSAFACARCGDRAAAKTKQMSLSRAPPTLVLHLKRFRRGAKIDRHVAFPFALDIAPYASSAAERARVAFGDRARDERRVVSPNEDDGARRPRARADVRSAYELFAVVVHSGGMESGHYVCYVKCQNAWFRCDDHMVSRADPVVVAAAQAYMLFYHAV